MENKRLSRREALGMMGAAGAAITLGCGSDSAANAGTTTPTGTPSGACAVTPSETVGPFPSLANLMRSDIREGKSGVPVTLTITVVNVNNNCSAVANAMVDIWQCDAEGHYSEYSQPGYNGAGQTFLRGIQTTDGSGRVTFVTIVPGWYQGRATHIHVEVTVNGRSAKVTQIAFPESVMAAAYATSAYAARGPNPTSNASDGIFADSLASELATVSGDAAGGFMATFTVGVAV